jgi:hypothetical protein
MPVITINNEPLQKMFIGKIEYRQREIKGMTNPEMFMLNVLRILPFHLHLKDCVVLHHEPIY